MKVDTMINMTQTVRHTETHAQGTVRAEQVFPAERVGDCAGLWYHVEFDDGLICWVPAALTEVVKQPCYRCKVNDLSYSPFCDSCLNRKADR